MDDAAVAAGNSATSTPSKVYAESVEVTITFIFAINLKPADTAATNETGRPIPITSTIVVAIGLPNDLILQIAQVFIEGLKGKRKVHTL